MTAAARQKTTRVLGIVKARHTALSDSEMQLMKRIVEAALKLESTKNLDNNALIEKLLDVKDKYVEFFSHITLDPIYTVDDDRRLKEQIDTIAKFLDARQTGPLVQHTNNFSDNRSATIGQAIYENPDILDTIRYLTGLGNITLELMVSGWLHRNKPTEVIKKYSMKRIKQFVREDLHVAKLLAENLLKLKLGPRLTLIAKLNDRDRAELVDILAHYQSKGHIAKMSGHKAEMIVAHHLLKKNIPFQPHDKLHTLGTKDIKLPQIQSSRLFDIAIPNVEQPKIVIEAAYYNSNTGSVASKVVRELEDTKKIIQTSPDQAVRDIKLIGFLDGMGWVAMTGHLIKMLLILDDFIQLDTIYKLKKYI